MVVKYKNLNNNISMIIDSLINMILNKDLLIEKSDYYYHYENKEEFIIILYLLKLITNNIDYIKTKTEEYINKIANKFDNKKNIIDLNIKKITNLEVNNLNELIEKLKEQIINDQISYDTTSKKIYLAHDKWLDATWLCSYLSMILDSKQSNKIRKDITICYTIPSKNLEKATDMESITSFFSNFTYYSIQVKYTDKTKPIKENNVLIIKNAAINYLKHLKQYKYGLENEESYLIFYNLLKNECYKQGFVLKENINLLSELDDDYLSKIKEKLNNNFFKFRLGKQIHTIENIIWQLSNDLNLLEQTNIYYDSTVDLISLLNKKTPNITYNKLKWTYNLHDIQILLILITLKFSINYLFNKDEIDYSLLNLSHIKPQYMNSICDDEEEEIKRKIHNIELEIESHKKSIEQYKQQRSLIDKKKLGTDKYLKELETCVSNINRASINIGTLNSKIANLTKEYEEIKKQQENKYKDINLYNYNHSIIRHICNSILSCSFYLKTNNNKRLLENIIVFEDYIKSDNAFYLEISFQELLKISHPNVIIGLHEQDDLPKLAQ